jgi:hypothetical protein
VSVVHLLVVLIQAHMLECVDQISLPELVAHVLVVPC